MKYIQARDFETTPTQYVEYLKHEASNAMRHLSEPEVQWRIGSSHSISRNIINECKKAYQELIIDEGRWFADGKFAGFEA